LVVFFFCHQGDDVDKEEVYTDSSAFLKVCQRISLVTNLLYICPPEKYSINALMHICQPMPNSNESAFCRLLKTDLYRRGWAGGTSE